MKQKKKYRADSTFQRMLNSPNRKIKNSVLRVSRYSERNFVCAWGKLAGSQPLFCLECKTEQCTNSAHRRIQLNPIIRIPRKTASKLRWKQFFNEVHKFHSKTPEVVVASPKKY